MEMQCIKWINGVRMPASHVYCFHIFFSSHLSLSLLPSLTYMSIVNYCRLIAGGARISAKHFYQLSLHFLMSAKNVFTWPIIVLRADIFRAATKKCAHKRMERQQFL